MNKAYEVGEKLFFCTLIICLISFIYFKIIPIYNNIYFVNLVICFTYFFINIYFGYKYNLKIKEGIIVGIMGCGVGLFLAFFALYIFFILKNSESAIQIVMPYLIPTKFIMDNLVQNIDLMYLFDIMIVNILLVVFGGIIKKIVDNINIYK